MDQNKAPKHTVIALWKHYERCFVTLLFLLFTHLFLQNVRYFADATCVEVYILFQISFMFVPDGSVGIHSPLV